MLRYAYCTFADDVRQEIGSKITIVGVYGSEMYVSDVPAFLPRLCILANLNVPSDEVIEALSVSIFFDEEVLQEIKLPPDALKKVEEAQRPAVSSSVSRKVYGLRAQISPFVISREGTVSVNILADGENFLAGKLRVLRGTAQAKAPDA